MMHPGARRARHRWLRLAAGVAVPTATYLTLAATLHSDLTALAVTEAIPVVWLLANGARKRRVDPIVLAVAVVLAIAVLVSLAAGGSVLPLKLRRAVVTGSIGIACLGSVLIGRPLLPIAMDSIARSWPRAEPLTRLLGGRAVRRETIILTVIVGLTLLADAAAQVTLALTVSTAAFLGAGKLARTAVFATGIAICALYLRHASPRTTEP